MHACTWNNDSNTIMFTLRLRKARIWHTYLLSCFQQRIQNHKMYCCSWHNHSDTPWYVRSLLKHRPQHKNVYLHVWSKDSKTTTMQILSFVTQRFDKTVIFTVLFDTATQNQYVYCICWNKDLETLMFTVVLKRSLKNQYIEPCACEHCLFCCTAHMHTSWWSVCVMPGCVCHWFAMWTNAKFKVNLLFQCKCQININTLQLWLHFFLTPSAP